MSKDTEKKSKKRKNVEENGIPEKRAHVAVDNDDQDTGDKKGAIIEVDVETEEDRKRLGISVIAQPLANKKIAKKCLKLVKRASKVRQIRRGVKEVVKAIRKGEKGILLIAGNITPIDVITHLPVLCETNEIPYIYIPLKEQLGAAGMTKRPTSCVLIQCKSDSAHSKYYNELKEELGTNEVSS